MRPLRARAPARGGYWAGSNSEVGSSEAYLDGVPELAESGWGWHSRPSFSGVSGGRESPEPAGRDGERLCRGGPLRAAGFLRTTCVEARGAWAPGTTGTTAVWMGARGGRDGERAGVGQFLRGWWPRRAWSWGFSAGVAGRSWGELGAWAGVTGELRTFPSLPCLGPSSGLLCWG